MRALKNINGGLASFEFDRISKEERQDILQALFVIINMGCADVSPLVRTEAIGLLLNVVETYHHNFEEFAQEAQKNLFCDHVS